MQMTLMPSHCQFMTWIVPSHCQNMTSIALRQKFDFDLDCQSHIYNVI